MDDLSRSLPKKVEGTFDLPKIREMIMATSESHVLQFVEFELIRLSQLVSVGGNLNNAQVSFIAEQLVKDYPNETIADFKLCFTNGAKGSYGEIFRLDGIVIGGWMKQYLDDKYQVLEDSLMKEKEEHYKKIKPENVERDWLTEWEQAVKSAPDGMKAVPQLTDEEIKAEGQEKPKRKVYEISESEMEVKSREVHEKIFQCQYLTVKQRHPEWTEEQILQRCEELKQEVIEKEKNYQHLPETRKIWEKKKVFK